MPNETEDYNNAVRAALPAGMTYSANRYRYNNHSFSVFKLAAWYYYYLLRVNSPSNLFSANEVGVWYDPSDLTTLFQDSAGTTPVTAAGQPVGRMLDKSGRGNHATQATSAQRPIYGFHPYSGVRNVANGAAAFSDANYWPSTGSQSSGITATKTVGSDATGPYVDIRFFSALTTGTSYNDVYTFAYSRTAAAAGDTYTSSATLQLIGGTATNIYGMRTSVAQETAPATFISSGSSAFVTSSTAQTVSGTLTVTTGNQVRGSLQLTCALAVSIDVTYRIRDFQFEKSATRTAYQANFSQYNITEAGVPSVYYIAFDGVDDSMATGTITPNTDKIQGFAGIKKLSDATLFGMVFEYGDLRFGNNGTATLNAPSAIAGKYGASSRGTLGITAESSASYVGIDTAVLTMQAEISTNLLTIRRNGTQIATSSADQGTGNYRNDVLLIGRRGASGNNFNGNLYNLIVRFGPNLTASQITNTETWVNGKTGAY